MKKVKSIVTSIGNFFFFFSSRRRHTRYWRDWSSDVCSSDLLRQDFDRIVEQGWGATVEEYEIGLTAIAAPVRGGDGDVIAALSVSGPSFRMDSEGIPRLARRVVSGAEELSRKLGFFSRAR